MRRGCQVTVAGRGGGGYNKPPPGPLTHASGNRMRLHSHDANGSAIKDRFGSSRERSPSLGTTMPLSPSHLNTREKSPNPTSQDLQDCSMCLSAYIQSLNTVCGTACRLAQCLAQVGTENGCNETSGTGAPFHQLLRDAAEMWEGIARAVGVASTSVKNQTLGLLQEAQANQSIEFNDSTRKMELAKVMRTVLSTFLNLQYQFSLVVVERFSGMLQHLKEDVPFGSNGVYSVSNHEGGHRPSPSPSVSPHHPSPSPPQLNSQYSHLPSQQLLQQQMLQQQQHQQLALQQQALLQHMLQINSVKTSSHIEVGSFSEESESRHSSGASSSALQAPVPPVWSTNVGGPVAPYSSQNTSNTLSPGQCGVGRGDGMDALSRRWSMGATTPSEESYHDKFPALGPFSLIATRRWSVPETSEFDPSCDGFLGGHAFYGYDYFAGGVLPSFNGSKSPQNRGFHKGNPSNAPQFLSRENSCTRSPSHSRSVTPDLSRRVSSVSNEELQDIIDLLSMPLNNRGNRDEKSTPAPLKPVGGKSSYYSQKENGGNSPYQRIPENEQESQGIPSSSSSSTSSCNSRFSHENSNVSCSTDGGKNPVWSDNLTEETSSAGRKKSQPPKKEALSNSSNQISTSLWPPTDNVPGVTLTECVGESEKQSLPPWTAGERNCEDPSAENCLNRDSINRSSWPISSFSSLGIMDDMVSEGPGRGSHGGWPPRPNMAAFRRHSTDAPYLLPQGLQSTLSARTRSFENIASKVNGLPCFSGNETSDNSSLQDLFPASLNFSSPTTSQYSLFTSTS